MGRLLYTCVCFFVLSMLAQFCFGQAKDSIFPILQPCGAGTPSLSWDRDFNKRLVNFEKAKITGRFSSTNYVIPVVVHVLHGGEAVGEDENISWDRIKSQIDVLNADFSGSNSDVINTPGNFQSVIAGNTRVQFCLAKTDPDGNLLQEPGVNRINWKAKGWDIVAGTQSREVFTNYFELIIKPNTIWDPKRYLNIWVSDKKQSLNEILSGYARYPTFPDTTTFPELPLQSFNIETEKTSGIWIYSKYFGINKVIFNLHPLGRVATHEIGHWLGLYHTFETFKQDEAGNTIFECQGGGQDGYLVGDRCKDTPPQYSYNSSECRDKYDTCPDLQNLPDMECNHMGYSPDDCHVMFTLDQAKRIEMTMANGIFRKSLNSSMACSDCPELVIVDQSTPKSTVIPGETISIRFKEKAKGVVSAGPNIVSLHLSSNNILTPGQNGDLYLGEISVTQTLQPGTQTELLNLNVTIPSNTTPGSYYIFISADGTNIISECVEDNNFATVQITVLGNCSDLIVIDQFTNPSLINSGQTISIGCKVKNIGNTSANAPHFVNIHLSEDDVLTPGLNGDIYIDEMEVSEILSIQSSSASLSKQMQIPSWIPTGTYYVFFAADGRGQIEECDNTNNFATTILNVVATSQPTSTGQPIKAYSYWFDNEFDNNVKVSNLSANNYELKASIPMASLSPGLHTINIGFSDRFNRHSSYLSETIYKINPLTPAGLSKYEYWIDDKFDEKELGFLLPASEAFIIQNISLETLSSGLHTFNIRFKPDGEHWSSISTSLIYKLNQNIPTGGAQYEYWFDNNYNSKISTGVSSSSNYFLINDIESGNLATGLHTLHFRFKPNGKHWTTATSDFIYIQNSTLGKIKKFQYWIDDDVKDSVSLNLSEFDDIQILSNLSVKNIEPGLHVLHTRFENSVGVWSVITSSFFYRSLNAEAKEKKVKRYRYWFDSKVSDTTVVVLASPSSDFELLKDICTSDLLVGNHIVNVQFQDSLNNWSSIITTSFYKAPPSGLLIKASGPTTFCEGSNVILSAMDCGSCTYQWSNGLTTRTITVNQSGNYYVSVNIDNCVQFSDTLKVVVNKKPDSPLLINGSTSVSIGQSTSYAISSTANATGYYWTISGGGNIINGQNTNLININWTSIGNHTVSVRALNTCDSSDVRILDVQVSFPTSTSNVEDLHQLFVTPNPNSGLFYLHINGAQFKNVSFQILNVLGQTLVTDRANINSENFMHYVGISNLPNGLYFLKVNIGRSEYVLKIIKNE
ncbi:CARDB domain-containing protein [Lacibacter sediminis]|uniref:T9SS type A sorting domain-containing protein n=1 Tax=Lacibacter sediminis TaxID=2760713 RepID=A0A7G5XFR2_9BACT|nr:CARDB domain-containing protein [Lacibacter sediminis]QNA44315.1 T9SS type A sorting domain-containing protein [Lacibacter sediminis]